MVQVFSFSRLSFYLLLLGSGIAYADSAQEMCRISGALTVDNIKRTYLLTLPRGYTGSVSHGMIVALHGAGGSAAQFERDYNFSEANANGFIVVYPEGVQGSGPLGLRTWNAGHCCGPAQQQGIDDVKFITLLVERLQSDYCIREGIYITGMSNGGMMAYRLALELPCKVDAVAVVAASNTGKALQTPPEGLRLLHIHALTDTKVPPNGGMGMAGYRFRAVVPFLEEWAAAAGCAIQEETVSDGYRILNWCDCRGDGQVSCLLIQDGGHSWPGGAKAHHSGDTPCEALSATGIILDFFSGETVSSNPECTEP